MVCCMQFSPASGSLGEEAQLRDWQRPKYKWGLDVDNFLFPSDHGKITRELLTLTLWPLHDILSRCKMNSFIYYLLIIIISKVILVVSKISHDCIHYHLAAIIRKFN